MIHAEKIVQRALAEHGVTKNARVEPFTPQDTQPSFEAFTDLKTGQSTVRYNAAFQLPSGSRTFAAKKGSSVPLEACLRDVTGHECGHIPNRKRKACPGTVEEHERHFYEPIAGVLAQKGKMGAMDSITNLVEDLIDNTFLAQGMHAGLSLFYKDVAVTKPIAFLFGNEVNGISAQLLKKCDYIAEIPMRGKKESLNVAVATGVALFRMLSV